MEFIRHTDIENEAFRRAFALYQISFPAHEQRRLEDQRSAMADPRYFCESIWDGETFCGLMFYWELDGFSYIEHFAVDSVSRSQGIGSKCLSAFCAKKKRIILEIDPLVDEISVRRKGFYERLGFHYNGYSYTHPSYRTGCTPHQLLIMSWPNPITEEEFDTFSRDLWHVVMQYSQNRSPR